jgi:adenine deaminase
MNSFSISGNLVDVHQKKFYPAEIKVENGRIASIISNPKLQTSNYILPGFIDAHVHIESSMLVPSEFAKLAVVHGTVATVSDPHEIANVCGMEGVEFMIENGKTVPFKFNFGHRAVYLPPFLKQQGQRWIQPMLKNFYKGMK